MLYLFFLCFVVAKFWCYHLFGGFGAVIIENHYRVPKRYIIHSKK